VPNLASDIPVNVVRTKIPLISISFSSLVLIFVSVLVSSTIIQNVFVIFVVLFVVVDEKHCYARRAYTPSALTLAQTDTDNCLTAAGNIPQLA